MLLTQKRASVCVCVFLPVSCPIEIRVDMRAPGALLPREGGGGRRGPVRELKRIWYMSVCSMYTTCAVTWAGGAPAGRSSVARRGNGGHGGGPNRVKDNPGMHPPWPNLRQITRGYPNDLSSHLVVWCGCVFLGWTKSLHKNIYSKSDRCLYFEFQIHNNVNFRRTCTFF